MTHTSPHRRPLPSNPLTDRNLMVGIFRLVYLAGLLTTCWSANTRPVMPMDVAQVSFHNNGVDVAQFSAFDTNCWRCDANFSSGPLLQGASATARMAVAFPTLVQVEISEGANSSLLERTFVLGDRGVYIVRLQDKRLQLSVVIAPYNVALPIGLAVGVYAATALIYLLAWFLYQRRKRRETAGFIQATDQKTTPMSSRVKALDAVRGLAIMIMIGVNYGGGGYWFLNHSIWNGLTVADLVFPWFIWIMGVSMALSYHSVLSKSKPPSRADLMLKVIRRTLILFGLGLFINNGYDLSHWRIPGVLQRFAVAYLVISLIILFVPKRHAKRQVLSAGAEIPAYTPFVYEWIIIAALVVVWLLITFLLPVPGCPTGYLGPGGLSGGGALQNCTGGAAGYIDRLVFGEKLLYQTPTCQLLYHTGPYDPEGLLGNLTSIFLVYLGVIAGRILIKYRMKRNRHWMMQFQLICWGVGTGALGTFLALGRKNGGWIPLCKNLWSLSFVLVQGGTGVLLLALCFELIDRREIWSGSPMRFVGMNAIILYVSHEILQPYFPFSFATTDTHGMQLLSCLVGASTWVVIAYYFYRIKFFVKI